MRHSWIVLVVTASVLAGCGGGGGGGGAVDVNGWWSWDLVDPPGTGVLGGVVYLQIEDTGSAVRIMDLEFPRTNGTFAGRYPANQPNYQDWLFQIQNANAIDGTVEKFNGGSSQGVETYQLAPVPPPSGTLSVAGTLFGEALAVNAAAAYGTDASSSGMYVITVRYDTARKPFYGRFRILLGAPVPAQTYNVGNAIGDVDVEFAGVGRGDSIATAGQLVIDSINATRVTGSFDFTLGAPDAVLGSFDVPLQPAP